MERESMSVRDKLSVILKYFIDFLSAIPTIGTIVVLIGISFDNDQIGFLVVLAIALFASYLFLAIKKEDLSHRMDFFMHLIKRGHLHTARMVMGMEDSSKRKQNDMNVLSADFNFLISKDSTIDQVHDTYSIKYQHFFRIRSNRTIEEAVISSFIFGEENAIPKDCLLTVENPYGSKKYPCVPNPMEAVYSDCPSNNGVYRLEWRPKILKGESMLTMSYDRVHAYSTSRDELFVICPNAFMPGIKTASFSVKEEGNTPFIEQISLMEISKGIKTKVLPRRPLICNENRKVYSTSDRIKVKGNCVYIITIKHIS